MFGDSTANSLGWTLRGVRNPAIAIELHGKDGFNLLYDTTNTQWTYDETKERYDAAIAFVGGAFLYGVTVRGEFRRACTPKWNELFEAGLAARLGELVKQKTRVFVATLPQPLGPYDNASFREQTACINRSIRKVAAATPPAAILDLAAMVCPGGECVREHDGVELRPDGVHYDMEGASEVAKAVLATIAPKEVLEPRDGGAP